VTITFLVCFTFHFRLHLFCLLAFSVVSQNCMLFVQKRLLSVKTILRESMLSPWNTRQYVFFFSYRTLYVYSPDLSKQSYVKSIIFTLETFHCKNWISSQQSPSKISTFNRFRFYYLSQILRGRQTPKTLLKIEKETLLKLKKIFTYSITLVRAISC